MLIGVVEEIKTHEYRVALTPHGAEELVEVGHSVLVQAGAGAGSGLQDESYVEAGAQIAPDAAAVFGACDMVLKVKEPLEPEWALMREGQILFTYLHLAADRRLTDAVLATGSHCFAYETLALNGRLPLLEPMSEVAGRLAIQAGAKFLERPMKGRGILLGGVPGVAPAEVLILGGGVVGTNAAKVAAGLGARVVIMDVNVDRLRYLDDVMPVNVDTVFSDRHSIRKYLRTADLVIGAVL
ncbi:MAG: alanine dehydrogenase, partial [Planctomycetota bacterium]